MESHFAVDDTGDVASDDGLKSYIKRCNRRLSTRKGRFAHLPNYGVTFHTSVKKLARQGLIEATAAEAEEQLSQEPETLSVAVRIEVRGSVARYLIRVHTTSFGDQSFESGVSFEDV